MQIIEKKIQVKDFVTKSNLPASDFVINPYIGCPHGCKYCYACFMKRFTNHKEEWGKFIDIKYCEKPISKKRLQHKSIFLSSVTDCYNKFEEKYCVTENILEQLVDIDCDLGISTKSNLILRDIELLKKCKRLKVSISINTLDEQFRSDMDCASTIEERIKTLDELHKNGIYTILFMSPIFPEITDFRSIIKASKSYVDEFWFENLNLRGGYKDTILSYIDKTYPQYSKLYISIYKKGYMDYWNQLAVQIEDYCQIHSLKYMNYFFHDKLVADKKQKGKYLPPL